MSKQEGEIDEKFRKELIEWVEKWSPDDPDVVVESFNEEGAVAVRLTWLERHGFDLNNVTIVDFPWEKGKEKKIWYLVYHKTKSKFLSEFS